MKSLFFKYITVFSLITLIMFYRKNLSANNPGSTLVNGIGLSAEYCYSDDKKSDAAAYLSYRYGFIWIMSGFLTADAGCRFDKETMNFKAGISGMILFWGLEAGVAGVRNKSISGSSTAKDGESGFAPGVYMGFNFVVPMEEYPVFLSAGKSFYVKNHEHEYYAMLTCLVNFSY